jgi:hypothetical protein
MGPLRFSFMFLSYCLVSALYCLHLEAFQNEAPLFCLHTVNGAGTPAPLRDIREDWSISLGAANPTRVKGADVVSLRRSPLLLPASPRGEFVQLVNGDQIPGTPLSLAGQRLRFRAPFQAQGDTHRDLELPLPVVSVVWLAALDETDRTEAVRRRLNNERRKRDTVILRNGDMVEGTLLGLDDKTLELQSEDHRELKIERSKVAAIALNTELARSPRPKGTYGRLVLENGCRLSLVSASADSAVLSGKTFFGTTVQIPVDQMIALDLRQGRAVYLSDLKPRRYEHTPYLGARWPYSRDASVAGQEIRLAGSTYDKGIGMHSESRLTYDLAGSYQWFESLVGLDDNTGRKGSVRIEVLVDGKPVDVASAAGGSGRASTPDIELKGGSAPRSIRVSVSAAKELTLVVKFGGRGDVQDHVDWADARLIK